MTKFKRPVDVIRNSLMITWNDHSYRCIGSDDVHFTPGTRRVKMDIDVYRRDAGIGEVRLLSSTGSARGFVKSARDCQTHFVGLDIELVGDVYDFIEGATDWVMIQYEV